MLTNDFCQLSSAYHGVTPVYVYHSVLKVSLRDCETSNFELREGPFPALVSSLVILSECETVWHLYGHSRGWRLLPASGGIRGKLKIGSILAFSALKSNTKHRETYKTLN